MHQLALRMGRTVGELSAVLTTEEQARWMALHRRAPITDERRDYLFARLCLLVAQVSGAKKKPGAAQQKPGPNDFTLEDFLMWKPKAPPPTPLAFLRGRMGHAVIKRPRRKTSKDTDGAR